MIKTDESALICDLAETYHVFDYRSLPVKLVATFSAGLRENSRIKMKMAGMKYEFKTLLLASILDGINIGNWMRSDKNRSDRPESMVNRLLGISQEDRDERELFLSAEEFEQKRMKLIENGDAKWQEQN